MQEAVYERARLARDARFDGRFYIGVRTTGIYCRPICPANSPKAENVSYFRSAAAAAEAGFRPCLRCRPESAPGSPAWLGTSTTVRRALKLIVRGALDDSSVEQLAERLGVTDRHLRRLFNEHIGASPLAVAHTQRLHFAKRLIDETALPMTDVAHAAGYGSVRRFNDAFRRTYQRTPRDLRKRAKVTAGDSVDAALTLSLPYQQPLSWDKLLAFFQARATPGVEAVDGETYARTVSIGGERGLLEVCPSGDADQLRLTLHGVGTTQLFAAVQRIRELFDLDAPVADIGAALGKDPALRKRLRRFPGIRVIGSWSGFELAVRAILGQQVSVAAATTLAGRVAQRYGSRIADTRRARELRLSHAFPEPDVLSRAHFNDMGLIGSRIRTIKSVARAVVNGDIHFEPGQEVEDFKQRFTAIKGIGDWTAQYVAMRVLRHPDAFPASDLGLLKALEPGRKLTPAQLADRAERWRPWRAYAAALLWYATPGSGG